MGKVVISLVIRGVDRRILEIEDRFKLSQVVASFVSDLWDMVTLWEVIVGTVSVTVCRGDCKGNQEKNEEGYTDLNFAEMVVD